MIVERTDEEVIIRLPGTMNVSEIQDIIDFFRFKELTNRTIVDDDQVFQVSMEAKKGRWERARKSLIK
jgi:hypothetical protein